MPKVLIADSNKSSLVMTSEVFKDKMPGSTVVIAKTGQECLEKFDSIDHPDDEFDMIILDFDLPDTDGITLTKIIRSKSDVPIIITAFPEKIVDEAINKELFSYHDSSMWVKKPVRFESLSEKIEIFLINKKRLCKRFETEISALVVGKGAGRGKRAPKVKGRIVNIGIGGAMICLEDGMRMKIGDEVMMTFEMPVLSAKIEVHKVNSKKVQKGASKVKAKVAWTNRKKDQVGFRFEKLTDSHKRALEVIFRGSQVIEIV